MSGWTHPLNLLKEEMIQVRDEGATVSESLISEIESIPGDEAWNFKLIDPLYERITSLEKDGTLAEQEPSELNKIRRLRPDGPRNLHWKPSETELIDKIHGAITGRCVGCALGKPLESMGFTFEDGRPAGRANIRNYLTVRRSWPLADYVCDEEVGDPRSDGYALKLGQWCKSLRRNIAYMENDDDICYTLVGLGVLESSGTDFQWNDVAEYWTNQMPYGVICTAENQAIRNYWSKRAVTAKPKSRATYEFTRFHRNPYREWIGAQIRADGWAYACAGMPEKAAELAWRDACWTHERNGIYGEMFFAALIAAAFVESDPRVLIEIGLSEIPRSCRLAIAIRNAVQAFEEISDPEVAMDWVELRCAEISPWHYWEGEHVHGMNPIHTFNNALICVLALLYENVESVCGFALAVTCGMDTDCNGATVGSISGAVLGKKSFPGFWGDRLNEEIRTNLAPFTQTSMIDLAQRFAVQRKAMLDIESV